MATRHFAGVGGRILYFSINIQQDAIKLTMIILSFSKFLSMSWTYLLIAALFEVGWAVGLEYTEGFTRPVPSVLTVIAMVISMGLLAQAVKTLPIGTAYAVWTGIGAVGTAIAGILLFGEPRNVPRFLFIGFIIAGVAGLKLTGGH